jgi:hypothetical protein
MQSGGMKVFEFCLLAAAISARFATRADLADVVERLWWKRTSYFWIFEFHYERADYGADELLEPSEQLLAW